MTTSNESSLNTSQDNVGQVTSPIPLENLKQSSTIPQADNTINSEISCKDSILNDIGSEDDVKFESTSLSETNTDERKEKIDQTPSSSGSKEYHEPTSEIDNALPYCTTKEKGDQNDIIDSDNKEKTTETENQDISDDHAIPKDIGNNLSYEKRQTICRLIVFNFLYFYS